MTETLDRFGTSAVEEDYNRPTAFVPTMVQQSQRYLNSHEAESREKYKNKLFGLGVIECVLGALCIILAIASLSVEIHGTVVGLENLFTYTAQGIWSGFFIVITGILGTCTKGNPSLQLYNANMALSIITAVFTAAAIVLSSFASLLSFGGGILLSHFVIHSSISLLLFAAFVIVIVHSGFCCAGVCKTEYSGDPIMLITQVPLQANEIAEYQSDWLRRQ